MVALKSLITEGIFSSHQWQCRWEWACHRLSFVTQQHHCSLTLQRIWTEASPPVDVPSGLPRTGSPCILQDKSYSCHHPCNKCVERSMCILVLTCTRVCVELWLCCVSQDTRPNAIQAVVFSVILQSCLLWVQHVVLILTTTRNEFWYTELLL